MARTKLAGKPKSVQLAIKATRAAKMAKKANINSPLPTPLASVVPSPPLTSVVPSNAKFLAFQPNAKINRYPFLKSDDMHSLSNYSAHSVVYKGFTYATVEHAYQAQKYLYSNNPEFMAMFYLGGSIASPADAKRAGSRMGMLIRGVVINKGFLYARDQIMEDLVASKINRHADIREILHACRQNDITLVYTSPMDKYWGANKQGFAVNGANHESGLNKLGELFNRLPII